jgi:hypothetical protein
MTTLPTEIVVLLGLARPFVALVAIVAGDLRERNRQKHDQKIQLVELEAQRLSKLREDRLQAYSTLARLSKVIEPTPPQTFTGLELAPIGGLLFALSVFMGDQTEGGYYPSRGYSGNRFFI